MSERIRWIDVAKGLGVVYVILGHFMPVMEITIPIYAFHMPFFFFLAGMTFEEEEFRYFVKKKFEKIMIPYYIFSTSMLLYYIVAGVYKKDSIISLVKKTIGIIVCWKTTDYYCGVWFLPCIFCVYVIANLILKHKNILMTGLIVAVLFIVGNILCVYELSMPLGLDTAMIALVFFYFGYVFKNTINAINSPQFLMLFGPMIVCAFFNYKMSGKRIEMFANDYGNILLFLTGAFCGIIASIGLAKFLEKKRILEYLGKESLYLYGAQLILFSLFDKFMISININTLNIIYRALIGLSTSLIVLGVIWKIRPIYYIIYRLILSFWGNNRYPHGENPH